MRDGEEERKISLWGNENKERWERKICVRECERIKKIKNERGREVGEKEWEEQKENEKERKMCMCACVLVCVCMCVCEKERDNVKERNVNDG